LVKKSANKWLPVIGSRLEGRENDKWSGNFFTTSSVGNKNRWSMICFIFCFFIAIKSQYSEFAKHFQIN
jgi:hypothetical protein